MSEDSQTSLIKTAPSVKTSEVVRHLIKSLFNLLGFSSHNQSFLQKVWRLYIKTVECIISEPSARTDTVVDISCRIRPIDVAECRKNEEDLSMWF